MWILSEADAWSAVEEVQKGLGLSAIVVTVLGNAPSMLGGIANDVRRFVCQFRLTATATSFRRRKGMVNGGSYACKNGAPTACQPEPVTRLMSSSVDLISTF